MSARDKDELARLLGQMASGGEGEEAPPETPIPVENQVQTTPVTPLKPVPIPPQTVRPTPLKPPVAPAKQHFAQGLEFKRTLIPILLTLGVICPVIGLMGFLVGPMSPFVKLKEARFSVPFILIGVVMLGLGVVTMLQVRHELKRHGGT